MEEFRQYIQKHIPISDNIWNDVSRSMETRHLKKKEYFLQQGNTCRHIGFIVKGYVRLFYLKDGIEITKDFNFENSFCGSWASFSLAAPSQFNVMAMEETDLITFTRDQLYSWFEQFPQMEKMGRLNMEHMFIQKELREASFLLDDAEERYDKLLQRHPQFLQRVPQKYLASYLGLTAETLSRIRKSKMRGI